MSGLPRDIRILTETTAVCLNCNAVMRAAQPWQLTDLTRRHAAESHHPTPAANPPSAAGASPVPPAG